MRKLMFLAIIGMAIASSVSFASGKDKGETAHPTSQKRFVFE